MKLVSIIVPVYNVELYLDRCIQSVINQTYKNIEIILIDDGSRDKSGKICDKYSKLDNRVIVVHKKNEGVSKARNNGLDIAKGEYIGFIDSDDYFKQDMIEKMVESIEKNNVDLAMCNYFYNKETNLNNILDIDTTMEKILSKKYFRGFVFNKLYRRDVIDKLRFNKDIYIAEDLLFNCEYLLKCKKCSYINERLYYYCINTDSATNKKINNKYLTIFDAYEKIEEIYKNNYSNIMQNLYIDMFKIACDIIYRNSKNPKKDKLDMTNVLYRKNKYFKFLMNTNRISNIKKLELLLYNSFPVLIGNMRNLKYKIHSN